MFAGNKDQDAERKLCALELYQVKYCQRGISWHAQFKDLPGTPSGVISAYIVGERRGSQ